MVTEEEDEEAATTAAAVKGHVAEVPKSETDSEIP